MNRQAVQLADGVAAMFEEQARWAAEEGAGLIIGETFYDAGEARLAWEVIAELDLPAVITLALPATGTLLDDVTVEDACADLEDHGADVVGLNRFRGPATTVPPLPRILDRVSIRVAASSVPSVTADDHPTFFDLPDPDATAAPPDFSKHVAFGSGPSLTTHGRERAGDLEVARHRTRRAPSRR